METFSTLDATNLSKKYRSESLASLILLIEKGAEASKDRHVQMGENNNNK